MSGLADELLADLDGLSGDENEEYPEDEPVPSSSSVTAKRKAGDANLPDGEAAEEEEADEDEEMGEAEREGQEIGSLVLEGGVRPADELDAEDVQAMELGGIEDVTKIAKLEGSKRMAEILQVCCISPCIARLGEAKLLTGRVC